MQLAAILDASFRYERIETSILEQYSSKLFDIACAYCAIDLDKALILLILLQNLDTSNPVMFQAKGALQVLGRVPQFSKAGGFNGNGSREESLPVEQNAGTEDDLLDLNEETAQEQEKGSSFEEEDW